MSAQSKPSAQARTTDPIIGTWQLNLAKAGFSRGPAPKSETRIYVVEGPIIHGTSKIVAVDGKVAEVKSVVSYDETEQKISGDPDVDFAVAETD